jgi:CRP-like cAMP-binding protein
MIKNIDDSSKENLFGELSRVYLSIAGHNLPQARKIKKGQVVYAEGQVAKGVYYIKSGSVKVTQNNIHRPITIRLAVKHDFVGYVSLLKQWDYDSTVIAIEDSELYFIPKQIFLKAIQTDNKFTGIILDILCDRIKETNSLVIDLMTKQVQQRLAILLLTVDNPAKKEGHTEDGIIRLSKKDIAAILNISPETLSRNLAELNKTRAIKLSPKEGVIEILSKQKLLEVSQIRD